MKPQTLWVEPELDTSHDWTFNGAPTRQLTHCYHDYPARMIPQVAGKLLDMFGQNARTLFDPYNGSGTSLVEGFIRGINVNGTDLNPLARLIAKAKTTYQNLEEIDRKILELRNLNAHSSIPAVEYIEGITRLGFWFKPEVVEKLSILKGFLNHLHGDILLFFQVAFSETVRESSNTRNEEFKLYKYDETRLEKFNPDVFSIMMSKVLRNREGLKDFLSTVNKLTQIPTSRVFDFNTVEAIPEDKIAPESIDIVVTSPPYGDSGTTVAYGQYSRLSAAWLDLPEAGKIDQKLMGSKKPKDITNFCSVDLNRALQTISLEHPKRALEVAAFYEDLYGSIKNVASIIRPQGYVCYVVGNRKVKGVVLPTDNVIKDFFEPFGFSYVDTFHRGIPNKRMPSKNSPSNAPGKQDDTMTREYIVVLKKTK
jgi:site-specific DNA-methyltransferase (cytosine-N4-specific)